MLSKMEKTLFCYLGLTLLALIILGVIFGISSVKESYAAKKSNTMNKESTKDIDGTPPNRVSVKPPPQLTHELMEEAGAVRVVPQKDASKNNRDSRNTWIVEKCLPKGLSMDGCKQWWDKMSHCDRCRYGSGMFVAQSNYGAEPQAQAPAES